MRLIPHHVLVAVVVCVVFLSSSCTNSPRQQSSAITSSIWVATPKDQRVRAYTIDRTSGSIAAVGNDGTPVATGAQPSAITLTLDGSMLFIANAGDGTVRGYVINSDGSLSVNGTPVPTGVSPMAMAVDPTNAYLFVANFGSDSIMVFAIRPGSLELKDSLAIQVPAPAGGSGPVALAVSPASFPCTDNRTTTPVPRTCYALYSANQTSSTVTAYDYFVDTNGNFLFGSVDLNGNFVPDTAVSGSPYSAGTNPAGMAFSRCAGVTSASLGVSCQSADGNNLFVANSGSNDVTVFSACIQVQTCQPGKTNPDGTLTQLGSPIAAVGGPSAVMVDPAADFVYVLGRRSSQISEFQYDPARGTLTSLGATNPSATSLLSGAITTNIANASNSSNWLLMAGNGALLSLSVGGNGTLNASSGGQVSTPGQASAVAIR